jgi:serine/threonine-protein kinase
MPLSVGARLGPYEVLSLIGAGGMGEVYRARDVRLGRQVALKVPPDTVREDADLRRRFEDEARAAAALSHPHICAIFDVGHQDDVEFIVMELLDGETLAQRLAAGALPIATAVPIAAQIADALTEAHRAGLIHRDLKPGNVMLVRSGAKLLDFGIARFATGMPDAAPTAPVTPGHQTDRGTILGTLQYMSPEQLEGRELATSSDVFSFGAVLYEMVTGRAAFGAESRAATIAAILMRSPAAPRVLAPELPAELNDLIEECLSKDPFHRPTAGNVYTRLRALAAGPSHPVRHGPAKPSPRAIRSLAVLALTTRLQQEAEEAFAAGMVDSLITSLAAFPTLRVISRMSSQRFAGGAAPVETAARELQVDAVVGVEVHEIEPGRLSVDAELIAATTQSRLWSGHFSCDRSEVLQVPEQISYAIGQKIRAGSGRHRAPRQRRVNRLAHEHYLKGSFLLDNRIGSWLETSFDAFSAALALDPGSAPAHVGLSRCYATAALRSSGRGLPPFIHSWREGFDKAESEARSAIAIDPEYGSAHSALAAVLWVRFRLDEAEDSFQRALALDPNDSATRVRYSLFLNVTNRASEALAHARFARDRDPLTTVPVECHAVALYTSRQFDACIACCDEGLELNPHSGLLHLYRGLSQAMLGQLEAAVGTLRVARAEMGDEASALAALATVHARRGERGIVEELLRQLQERGEDLVSLAEVYAAIDRPHDALDALEKAFEMGAAKLLSIGLDPAFDAIRDRPRFKRLLVGTGLAPYLEGPR